MVVLKDDAKICPIEHTLRLVGGKWKLLILWHLNNSGVLRYGELKRVIPEVTHKMLSQQLKELQADNFICREEYCQIPPKVEYSLTDYGKSIMPILESISMWGMVDMA